MPVDQQIIIIFSERERAYHHHGDRMEEIVAVKSGRVIRSLEGWLSHPHHTVHHLGPQGGKSLTLTFMSQPNSFNLHLKYKAMIRPLTKAKPTLIG